MSIANRAFRGALAFALAAFSGQETLRQKMAVNQNLIKARVRDPEFFHHFATSGAENYRAGPGTRRVKRLAAKAKGRLRNRLAHRG